MRALAVLAVALVLVPCAAAKGRMTLALGDSSPGVGQPITVVLRFEQPLDAAVGAGVRIVAVAPGRSWYDVVGVVTGASRIAQAEIPRDGFGIELARVSGRRWRAFVSFPRPGRWLVIVPDWGGGAGFAVPPPIIRTVDVSAG